MLAAFVAPELEIAEEEAKELTAALAEVNSFYSQVVDPKLIAWMGLIGVAGKVYGPRLGAFMIRRRMEAAMQKPRIAPLSGNVPQQARTTPPAPVAPVARQSSPPPLDARTRASVSDPSFVPELELE